MYEKLVTEQLFFWLQRNILAFPLPSDIVSLYFGLFESETGYVVYLTGSKKFSIDNDSWTIGSDFEPTEKYLHIQDSGINSLDWQAFLDVTKNSLNQIILSDRLIIDYFMNIKHIATGFDDGDLYYLR